MLAVIPAYNEQDNIVSTIEDLRKNAPDIDYVIINDGSRDRTLDICKECGYNYVSLPVNLGLAGAFQTGVMARTLSSVAASLPRKSPCRPAWRAACLSAP